MKVGFQGLPGAYSEMALIDHFGSQATPISIEYSEDVFTELENNHIDYALLPVENSIVGNVAINNDLIYQKDVTIIGEHYLPINHCLLAKPGIKLAQIEKVISHPIALGQCRNFLREHKLESIATSDTAGSAQKLSQASDSTAAIASELAAKVYGLDIIAKNIQSTQNNITRFVVVSLNNKSLPDIKREKTSLAFVTKHHPGALLSCLLKFAAFNINLTKLESRPIADNPFQYTFFVDFEKSVDDDYTKLCLKALEQDVQSIKILGSYPLNTYKKS